MIIAVPLLPFQNQNLTSTAASMTEKMPRAKECFAIAALRILNTKNMIRSAPATPVPVHDSRFVTFREIDSCIVWVWKS